MDVCHVNQQQPRYVVRRVLLRARGVDSFTVVGPDRWPVGIVNEYVS